jgi:hypothetical protein
MVTVTNNLNLPQTLVNLARRDNYSRGKSRLSVTQIIDSPRVRVLREKHDNEIVTDVSDMVWPLMGRAFHYVVEQGADNEHLPEERLFMTVNGWVISGGVDLQRLGVEPGGTVSVAISDYKLTSAWAIMNNKADWERQLNIYAHLVEKTKGYRVKGLEIIAVCRDWNRHEAGYKEGYPQAPISIVPQRLWDEAERASYIQSRVALHQEAERLQEWGESPPECSEEERWYRPGKLAVMKPGGKRALKVFEWDERDEAEEFAKANKAEVEERPGLNTRCESFCSVSAWCEQFKKIKGEEQ